MLPMQSLSKPPTHLTADEVVDFEEQLVNNLAAQLRPNQKFVELDDAEKSCVGKKLLFAREKIVQAWRRSQIPASERKEAIKTICVAV